MTAFLGEGLRGAYFGGPFLEPSLRQLPHRMSWSGVDAEVNWASGFLHRFAFRGICFDNSSLIAGAFVKYFNLTLVLQPWWVGFMSGSSKMSDVTAFRLQLGPTPRLWMIELAALKKKAQVAVTTWSRNILKYH